MNNILTLPQLSISQFEEGMFPSSVYNSIGTFLYDPKFEKEGLKSDRCHLSMYWIHLGENHLREAGQRTQIKWVLWIFLRMDVDDDMSYVSINRAAEES